MCGEKNTEKNMSNDDDDDHKDDDDDDDDDDVLIMTVIYFRSLFSHKCHTIPTIFCSYVPTGPHCRCSFMP